MQSLGGGGWKIEGSREPTLSLLKLGSNSSEWVFGKMGRSTRTERNITFTLICSEHGQRLIHRPPPSEPIMQTAAFPDVTTSANEHVLRTLQSNKDHQAAVKTRIEQLEDDLATLDKLLVCFLGYSTSKDLTGCPRLLRRSTTKTNSNPRSAGTYPSQDLQPSQPRLLPKSSSPR